MRAIVIIHLLAVAITVAAARADSLGWWGGTLSDVLQVLFLIAIAAWWMCPIAMVIAARDRGQHGARVVYGLVAEAMLWVVQLYALLPMVSEGVPYL